MMGYDGVGGADGFSRCWGRDFAMVQQCHSSRPIVPLLSMSWRLDCDFWFVWARHSLCHYVPWMHRCALKAPEGSGAWSHLVNWLQHRFCVCIDLVFFKIKWWARADPKDLFFSMLPSRHSCMICPRGNWIGENSWYGWDLQLDQTNQASVLNWIGKFTVFQDCLNFLFCVAGQQYTHEVVLLGLLWALVGELLF